MYSNLHLPMGRVYSTSKPDNDAKRVANIYGHTTFTEILYYFSFTITLFFESQNDWFISSTVNGVLPYSKVQ